MLQAGLKDEYGFRIPAQFVEGSCFVVVEVDRHHLLLAGIFHFVQQFIAEIEAVFRPVEL